MKVRPERADGRFGAAHPEEVYSRGSLRLLVAYLSLTAPALVRNGAATGQWLPLALHGVALVLVMMSLRPRMPSLIRAWTPLALGAYLYVELRWIIEGVGAEHADATVGGWDAALAGIAPWHIRAAPSDPRWASELLHLAYLSYYALVLVPPALLWLRGRRDAFAETTFALMVVYALCFVTYIVFPVDGPRYLLGPAPAPEGPVRDIVIRVLAAGSSRGTAFPSAHVAASLVATLHALRFQRGVGIVALVLTAGLAWGAVYGGYHYGVDILAGAGVAAVAMALVSPALRWTRAAPAAPR